MHHLRLISKSRDLFRRVMQHLHEDPEAVAGSYWQMSAQDRRIQDQAHWCGVMRWPRERWMAYGDFYVAHALHLLNRFAGPSFFSPREERTALEWGCGGGANIRCLCRAFSSVYGLDISEETLNACERQMKKIGLENFHRVFIPVPHPEAVLQSRTAESIDFILSIAVFQHFPSKDYTRRVLQVMEKLLKKGGLAWIQVRYFDGSEKYRQKDSDYAKNVITMTSFTFSEFVECLQRANLELLHSERDIEQEDLCHEYYFVRKRGVQEGNRQCRK